MTQPVRLVIDGDAAGVVAATELSRSSLASLAEGVKAQAATFGTSTSSLKVHLVEQGKAIGSVATQYHGLSTSSIEASRQQIAAAEKATAAVRRHGAAVREEASATSTHLQTQAKKAGGSGGLFSTGASGAAQEESGLKRGFVSRLTGIGGFLAGPGFVAGAIGGITIDRVVKSTLAAQEATTQLQKAVQNTGKSWAVYGTQIDSTLGKQEKLSGFSKTDLTTTYTTMLRVTGNVTTATKDMADAEDVARGRHIALAQAALIVERAHEGNIGALNRLGIPITKVTTYEDELKNAHIKVTDANRAMVTELQHEAVARDKQASGVKAVSAIEKRYAGDSVAYTTTMQGRWTDLRNTLSDYATTVGTKAIPEATKLFAWLQKLIDEAQTSTRFHKDLTKAVNDLKDAWGYAADGAKVLWTVISTLGGFLDKHHGLVKSILTVWLAWRGAMLISSLVTKLQTDLKTMETAFGGFQAKVVGTSTDVKGIGAASEVAAGETTAATAAMDTDIAATGTAATVAAGKVSALGAGLGELSGLFIPVTLAIIVNQQGWDNWLLAIPKELKKAFTDPSGGSFLNALIGSPGNRGVLGNFLTGGGSSSGSTTETQKILNEAGDYSGGQYVWGGGHQGVESPNVARNKGLDCSGFITQVFSAAGFKGFGGTSQAILAQCQKGEGDNWYAQQVSGSEIEAGDLAWTNGAGHIGIVVSGKGGQAKILAYSSPNAGGAGNGEKTDGPAGWGPFYRVFLVDKSKGGANTSGHSNDPVSDAGANRTPITSTAATTKVPGTGGANFTAQIAAAKQAVTNAPPKGLQLHFGAGLSKSQQQAATEIYRAAIGAGLTPAQALQMVMAAYAESKLDPNTPGGGLFQIDSATNPKTWAAFQGYLAQGYDAATANVLAMLPSYLAKFKANPNAAPGVVASLVERPSASAIAKAGFSSEAAFYTQGLSSGLFSLGTGPSRATPAGLSAAAAYTSRAGATAFLAAQRLRIPTTITAHPALDATTLTLSKADIADEAKITADSKKLTKGLSATDVAAIRVQLKAAETDLRNHVSAEIKLYETHESAVKRAATALKSLQTSAASTANSVKQYLTSITPQTVAAFPTAIASTVTKFEAALQLLYTKLGQVKSKTALTGIKDQIATVEKTITAAMSQGAAAVSTASDRVWAAATTAIQRGFDATWNLTFQNFDDVTTAGLKSISDSTAKQIANATATVSGYWGSFQVAAGGQTPSEAALTALQNADAASSLTQALTDATGQLDVANRIGDPVQIAAAQAAVTAAQRAIDEAALQQKATDERTAADAALLVVTNNLQAQGDAQTLAYQRDRDAQRLNLQNQQTDAQTALTNQEADWKDSLDRRQLSWAAFIDGMNKYAAANGFAVGGALPANNSALGAPDLSTVAGIVAAGLPGGGGPAKGSIAQGNLFTRYFAQGGWSDAPNSSTVDPRDTINAKLRPGEFVLTPEMIKAGALNNGGDTYVQVDVHGNVTSEKKLALAIRDHLVDEGRRSGGDVFGGQA